jgi:hypothetical protein
VVDPQPHRRVEFSWPSRSGATNSTSLVSLLVASWPPSQVAISFATRTIDGAVAALGEEIRAHPDTSPVLLNDPAYVGVAVTSLPGRPGFQRVRTPAVDHHQVAAIIRATANLRADPSALLAAQAPGLPALTPPGAVA